MPDAEVPWSAVREIKAGNWVLWFKLDEPVHLASDRTGKRKKLDEIKLNLHGLRNGWANWPHNFDPVWLDACEGFTSREV